MGPFLKSKSKKPSKQEELEEELKFEEELEEAAETILEESDNVDPQMLNEMAQIKQNIQKLKEQILALKNSKKKVSLSPTPVRPTESPSTTDEPVQTTTSSSFVEEKED